MDLKDLRNEIDRIDDELVALFVRRMAVSGQVAAYKKEHGLPIFVLEREQEKLADVAEKAGAALEDDVRALYDTIFELSRAHQRRLIGDL